MIENILKITYILTMKQVLVKDIVNRLTKTMDCSERRLSNFLGMDKNTLSNNASNKIEELTPITRRKILSLSLLVLDRIPAYSPEAIYQILNAHVYKSHSGETDSIISAIQQDKFEYETLNYMLETARKDYENRLRSESDVDLEYVERTLLQA